MEIFIPIVIILFVLSLISERIVNFLKLNLPEKPDTEKIWGIFPGGPLRTRTDDKACEKIRERRVFALSFFCALIVSFVSKANLLSMMRHMDKANQTLGWDKSGWPIGFHEDYVEIFFGCILTAFFISLGSKFWHDLLDMLYEIKNYKRVLADPETYKLDNIKSVEKVLATYQSDFIKAAFMEARSGFMAMDNVKAFSLKNDNDGYYFEISVKQLNQDITSSYTYLLEGGIPQTVRIKIIELGNLDINAYMPDLSAKIYDSNHASIFGTLGCLVTRKNGPGNERYILTCCHNVVYPLSTLPSFKPDTIQVSIDQDGSEVIGKINSAIHDYEIDAALVKIDPEKVKKIINKVPQISVPGKARILVSGDEKKVKAMFYGANSKFEDGLVTSLYCDAKIKYGKGDEITMINLIAISSNGVGMAQGGDSGSVVLDDHYNVLGIVVAGSSFDTYVIPIETLMTRMNVQLV